MPWENRKGRGAYYTRTRRVNGRPLRLYFGCGIRGRIAAQQDAQSRRRTEAQHRKAEAVHKQFATEKALLDPLGAICTALMALALQAAGYHQHDRGEWRRRLSTRKQQKLTRREKANIDQLIEKAGTGDSHALSQLKALEEGLPAEYVDHLIQEREDSGRCVERILISFISGDDLLKQEALHRHADVLRAELGGLLSTPLESLLIDRVVTCWLHLNEAQAWCAAGEFQEVGGHAEACLQKRLSYGHQRFLQACKALASVRKLLGPNIQINVGEKQINVMEASSRTL